MNNYTVKNLVKTGGTKLPPQSSRWEDKIYEHINQTHPYIAEYLQGSVDWGEEPIDEDQGSGIGTITALIGDQPVEIPIVVRDFELSPIDIYIKPDGRKDLLDRDLLIKKFDPRNVQVGNTIDPYMDLGTNNMQTNWMGKIGSYNGFYEDCKRVLPELQEKYPSMSESIQKIAEFAQKNKEKKEDIILFQKNASTYEVTSFSQGQKTGFSIFSEEDAFAEESMLSKAARKVEEDGYAVLINRPLDKRARHISNQDYGKDPDEFDINDGVSFISEENGKIKGIAYPMTYFAELGKKDKTYKNIFISSDGKQFCVDPDRLIADNVKRQIYDQYNLYELETGDKGFLVVKDNKKKECLIGPLTITGNKRNHKKEREITLNSRFDQGVKIIASGMVLTHAKLKDVQGNNVFMLPRSTQFIPCSEEIFPASTSMREIEVKTASSEEGQDIVRLSENNGSYLCKAGTQQAEPLEEKEAFAWLMSLGCEEKGAKEYVKEARTIDSRIEIFGLESPYKKDKGITKKAHNNSGKVRDILDLWVDRKEVVNKLAASLQNGSQTQGQLASLNMMNNYNAFRYIDALDKIEDAKFSVADLLYENRKDPTEFIEDKTIKDALAALDAIVKGLKEVKASQK